MTDLDAAKQDIAFLKDLVDDDWRPATWIFGATYLAIGLAVAAQVLGQWAADAVIRPPEGAMLIWILAVWTLYALAQGVLIPRAAPQVRPAGLRDRAGGAAFVGMALSHLTMLAVFVIVSIRMQDSTLMQLAALSFFAMQGGMWFVLHAVRPSREQLVLAFAWLAATLACAVMVGSPHFSAAVGLVVLVLMVIPGAAMMRLARAAESE